MMASDTKADLLLSRFPGPVTLYPSRRKWLLVLLVGVLFTAVGIWMILAGNRSGWFTLEVFAIVAIVAAVTFLPGAAALTLDRNGFEVASLFRFHRSRWQEVSGFEFVPIWPTSQKLVAYDDIRAATRTLAAMNIAIADHNSALPNTYGLAGDDLARLLTQWRARAVAA